MKVVNIASHAIGEWFEVFQITKGTKEKPEELRSLREFIHGDDVDHLPEKFVASAINVGDAESAARGELNVVRFDFSNPIDQVSNVQKKGETSPVGTKTATAPGAASPNSIVNPVTVNVPNSMK